MLTLTRSGLFCPAGDFYIDPSRGVEVAIITHAHSDHARRGSRLYICARSGERLLRERLGATIRVRAVDFGETFELNGVGVSLHPAGHILGSAQVRLAFRGEVWVASGDYKRDPDPTCEPFEPVPCDTFVTEATFGTPVYQWRKDQDLGRQIHDWWSANAARGENSVLFAYSLGKAQRVLGVLHPFAQRPVYCDPQVTGMNVCYHAQGIKLAATVCLGTVATGAALEGELFLVPQAFLKGLRADLLGRRYRTAFASGWMAQGRFGGGYDHGFVMSDHADWNDLVRTVVETGARKVYVQHRGKGALVRHLRTLGINAHPDTELASGTQNQLSLF